MSATSRARRDSRVPVACLVVFAVVWTALAIAPRFRDDWLLENGLTFVAVPALLYGYPRFRFSDRAYVQGTLFLVLHTIGSHYTYSEVPMGAWVRDTFGLARNHYDRVGHVALGAIPCFLIREVLLRRTPLQRGAWLFFLVCSVVLALAAFWELLEWWTALVAAPDVGVAFLGSQGDVWDAQWDMLLALVGVAVAVPLFAGVQDRSMARVPPPDR